MNRFKLAPSDVFWYGAAISMVMVSVGICFSLIRGSEFNVEALDTKLELSGITSKNKELTKELKEVSREIKNHPNLPSYQLEEIEEIEQELEQAEQEIEEIEEKIIEDKKDDDDKPEKIIISPEPDEGEE